MSKSSRGGSGFTRGGRRSRNTSAVEVFHRKGPGLVRTVFCLLLRLRAEITVTLALFGFWLWLDLRFSPLTSYVVLGGGFVVVMGVPASRRFILHRALAVLSRHRLRACMVQIRTMNYDGLLPWIVWSRPTPVGERLWLWMRPGISVEELTGRLEHLAVSCWAREARVERSRRMAALVWVNVIRRDPLTSAKEPIPSPLRLVGKDGPTPPPVALSTGESPFKRAKNKADATSGDASTGAGSRTSTRKSSPRTPSSGLVVNGEDITDYVD